MTITGGGIVNLGVLIETYWNVNLTEAVLYLTESGLNRNILECKYIPLITMHHHLCSLNRNILECKYVWKGRARFAAGVLIETYWNVNP